MLEIGLMAWVLLEIRKECYGTSEVSKDEEHQGATELEDDIWATKGLMHLKF